MGAFGTLTRQRWACSDAKDVGPQAPFNPGYRIVNSSSEYVEYFTEDCPGNEYLGGATQQVTSGLCLTDTSTCEPSFPSLCRPLPLTRPAHTDNSTTNMNTYGVEYKPSEQDGWGTGSITWTQGGEKMWTLHDKAMGPNEEAQISQRWVTAEPMYIIVRARPLSSMLLLLLDSQEAHLVAVSWPPQFNLAMSPNFGRIDYDNLEFPSKFRIDYVRVYQPNDQISGAPRVLERVDLFRPARTCCSRLLLSLSLTHTVGCDPKANPTKDYIDRNQELYHNPNLTSYGDIPRTFPKNRLLQTCDA